MLNNSSLLKYARTVLFFLTILLLPTQLGKYLFTSDAFISGVRVDYLAVKLFASDIAILLLIGTYLVEIKKILVRNSKTIAAIMLICFINILFSPHPWVGFFTIIKYFEVFLLGVVVFKHKPNLTQLLIPLTIGVSVELLLSIAQMTNHGSIQGVFYWLGERDMTMGLPGIAKASFRGVEILRPYGTFSHPNSMGGFYVLLYILFLFYPRKEMGQIATVIHSIFLLLSSLLIFITFSRVVITTYVFITTIYILFFTKIDCRLCKFGRIFGIVLLGLLFATQPHGTGSITERSELIQNGIVLFFQKPILGYGVGQHLYGLSQFSAHSPYFFNQPIHNIFLVALVEWGVVVFGLAMFQLSRWVKKHRTNLVYGTVGVVVITGLTDHFWLTLQQNMLLLGVVGGLLYTKTNSPKKE